MRANLESLGGLVHSQRLLLALVEKGMSREEAYAAVQRNAMQAWSEGRDFAKLLKKDKVVISRLKAAEIDTFFDLGYHLKNVDVIFQRVFGPDPARKTRSRKGQS
jgi:adenylosuccinate lyase